MLDLDDVVFKHAPIVDQAISASLTSKREIRNTAICDRVCWTCHGEEEGMDQPAILWNHTSRQYAAFGSDPYTPVAAVPRCTTACTTASTGPVTICKILAYKNMAKRSS